MPEIQREIFLYFYAPAALARPYRPVIEENSLWSWKDDDNGDEEEGDEEEEEEEDEGGEEEEGKNEKKEIKHQPGGSLRSLLSLR